jgi:phage I-like protein
VKGKALRQLEEALDASASGGGDVLNKLKDLGASERDAALALGVDWRRYSWVKEEIARVLALQRQREDAELLAMELERSREDLKAQVERSRDASSRQFLQAQIASLERQLNTIEREEILDEKAAAELQLMEGVRVELAELQGQQDRVQRRIREMVRNARGGGKAIPPGPESK